MRLHRAYSTASALLFYQASSVQSAALWSPQCADAGISSAMNWRTPTQVPCGVRTCISSRARPGTSDSSLGFANVLSNAALQVIRMVGESQETVSVGGGSGSSSNKMPTLEEYGTNLTTQATEVKLLP